MKWEDLHSGKIRLQLCDIGFSRGKTAFGRSIQWATTGRGEKRSLTNHVFGVTDCNTYIHDGVIYFNYSITEALSRVNENNLYDYDNADEEIIIVRPLKLSRLEKIAVVREVRDNIGKIYSVLKIFGQAADNLINKVLPQRYSIDFFGRIGTWFSEICSYLWAVPLAKKGVTFGAKSPDGLDPDEMLDYCIEHPLEFRVIFVSDGMEKLIRDGNYTVSE